MKYFMLFFLFISANLFCEERRFNDGVSVTINDFEYKGHKYVVMKISGYNAAQIFHDIDCSCANKTPIEN